MSAAARVSIFTVPVWIWPGADVAAYAGAADGAEEAGNGPKLGPDRATVYGVWNLAN
jgi:hypothetical protein